MNNLDFWSALDILLNESEIIIDRPKGSRHPNYNYIYEVDYGYLKDTNSMDGGGIDVWRGSLKEPTCNAIICTVDLIKRDSEIKVLLGCTKQEKETVLNFHNDSDCMKGILIERNGGQNERK